MFKKIRITHARFTYSEFSSEQMAGIAQEVLDAVKARIKRGITCQDSPAKPLKPAKNGKKGYPERKMAAGLPPIRNWVSPRNWPTGRIKTLRAMKVTRANENRAIIAFVDPQADLIAHRNNQIEKMFGLSPADKEVFRKSATTVLKAARLISVQKAA